MGVLIMSSGLDAAPVHNDNLNACGCRGTWLLCIDTHSAPWYMLEPCIPSCITLYLREVHYAVSRSSKLSHPCELCY